MRGFLYEKSRETSDSTFAKCLKYLVIGCIAGLFLCAALLAICAFVFVLVKTIPTQAIQAVSIGISALSALCLRDFCLQNYATVKV